MPAERRRDNATTRACGLKEDMLLAVLLFFGQPPESAADAEPSTDAIIAGRSLITIENEKAEDESVDPDEYLWETLPGRCCFLQDADDCDLCSVWSDPQNFCHTSQESCELCGMSLYCPAPPPLLNANKVCKGESKVGEGCNDDLDTGLCQRSGALAECMRSCRHTKHCEMIVLFTDSMAGACVLCRNMLNYDRTEQASTRIYAVTHLDEAPPTPPGYQHDTVKHFTVLQDPLPPPPPSPPPRPPRAPPPPLPAYLGTKTNTHIECQFQRGMDIVVSGNGGGDGGGTTDTVADTEVHCCSQCGMQTGCTDFVYEPESRTCVLMPHLPSYRLKRNPNNSTIAGSVAISRIDQHHASCHFEVGSGYAGGAIGVGMALPGKTMSSKQDCCDACERDPRCAKFVFEHYGGDCQLFGPQSEKYYTFNLLSGTVDGRATAEDQRSGGDVGMLPDHDADWADEWPLGEMGPPAPPMMSFGLGFPPPSPGAKMGESGVASTVLADFSLLMGFLIVIVFSLFSYLFFAQDINSALYTASSGRLGKKPKSILDRLERAAERQGDTPQLEWKKKNNKRSALPEGWAKLTVQTSQVTQKKDVEVADCETLEELQSLIWEEFGHVLKTVKRKDMLLLVWTSGHDDGDDTAARWELVSAASDIQQVVACQAMKFSEKSAFDMKALTVAFTTALPDKSSKKSRRLATRLALQQREPSQEPADEEEPSDEDSPPGAHGNSKRHAPSKLDRAADRLRGMSKGGFQRVAAVASDDESDEEPLCADAPTPKPKALNNGRKAGRNAKELTSSRCAAGGGGRHSSRERDSTGSSRKPAELIRARDDEDDDLEMQLDGGKEFFGKRVEVCKLVGKAELNGRTGTAASFDKGKGRYRVRLDALDGEAQILGFKPENLRLSR